MIKIRNGMFETNSSSGHAIIVTKEKTEPVFSYIRFGFGEYGWEEREYHDDQDKANYFYTAAYAIYGEDVKEKIENALSEYGINCKFETPRKGGWFEAGYVDHSYDAKEFVDTMIENPEMLIRFLFNDDSFVCTGNDNSEMEWFGDIRAMTYPPHDLFVKGN